MVRDRVQTAGCDQRCGCRGSGWRRPEAGPRSRGQHGPPGGARRRPGRTRTASWRKASGIESSSSFEYALQNEAIDAVPPLHPRTQLHADQIVAAASAGKHVFCEKPLDHHHAGRGPRPGGRGGRRSATRGGARASLRAGCGADARRVPVRRDRQAAGPGGQLQPGQVPRPARRQLAALRLHGTRRSALCHRHPPRRPRDLASSVDPPRCGPGSLPRRRCSPTATP